MRDLLYKIYTRFYTIGNFVGRLYIYIYFFFQINRIKPRSQVSLVRRERGKESLQEERDTSWDVQHGGTASRLINERCFDQFTFTKTATSNADNDSLFRFFLPGRRPRVGVRKGVASLAFPRARPLRNRLFASHFFSLYVHARESHRSALASFENIPRD